MYLSKFYSAFWSSSKKPKETCSGNQLDEVAFEVVDILGYIEFSGANAKKAIVSATVFMTGKFWIMICCRSL